jgi:gliding motility-associated-like protein
MDHSALTSQWSWDFGDYRGNSILQNPVYSYTDTGTFEVRLISINEYGCKDTSYNKIQVRPEYGIFIPNAFTPNNDGVNDTFMPLMSGTSSFEMLIYDRWGIKIFETSELQKPWNGRFQNSENICQNDVYVYKVMIKDLSGQNHSVIGHVSLLK